MNCHIVWIWLKKHPLSTHLIWSPMFLWNCEKKVSSREGGGPPARGTPARWKNLCMDLDPQKLCPMTRPTGHSGDNMPTRLGQGYKNNGLTVMINLSKWGTRLLTLFCRLFQETFYRINFLWKGYLFKPHLQMVKKKTCSQQQKKRPRHKNTSQLAFIWKHFT